ncbi:MAG: hypothetical protein ABSE62_07570 [Chthoniobacteraceae bacterium]
MARIIDIAGLPRRLQAAGKWLGGLLLAAALPAASDAAPAIHALLVGGGPDKEDNTAQIEEHLRYVTSLVPASPGRIVLFADGRLNSRDLTYTDSSHLTQGQRALDILLPNDELGAKERTRRPQLGTVLDGPSRLGAIERAFERLVSLSGRTGPPILLYFAGHGSVSQDRDKYSLYNLWGDEDLDPPTLSHEIDTLPPRVPVTLVMAQCFSGGFGDVLFKKADSDGSLDERTITGFFAAESDREAAGCGTDTDSPLYQDFSSYFFGALSGRDKLGHRVEGADYDGNGRVSCYDAYCYALIHDESIDTPVCTSLVFLRRYADTPDASIYSVDWDTIVGLATPAQKAVLDTLSAKLSLDGKQRLLSAYDRLMFSDPVGQPAELRAYRDAQDRLNALRMDTLRTLFQKWPALRWSDSRDYDGAARNAEADLEKDATHCQEILQTSDSFDRADAALDTEESLLVRFTDMAEAILRARDLRASGDPAVKARFEALWRAEQQPLAISSAIR